MTDQPTAEPRCTSDPHRALDKGHFGNPRIKGHMESHLDEMIGLMFLRSLSSALWWVNGNSAQARAGYRIDWLKPVVRRRH
jgi:hypothetical protein